MASELNVGGITTTGNVGVGGSPSGDDLITVGDGTATNGAGIRIYSQRPMLRLFEQDTTNQNWQIESDAGVFKISTQNDAFTSVSNKLTIANSGLASFSAGIAFSGQTESTTGTPAASSVLSHYETGTWTATDDSGAGLTLAVSDFSYTRIGDRVFVSGYFAYPTTSDTTNAKIGGLPFNVANDNYARGLTVSWADATTLAYTLPIDNQDQFRLYDSSGNALTNATLTSRTIYISGVYRV